MKTFKSEKRFYPDYLSEIIFSILIALELLLVLVLIFPPEVGRQIDFSKPFQPLPEWYFLWLFELVSYFPGNLMFIGTFLIPLSCILLLLLIPFLDKGKYGRIKAYIAGSAVLLVFCLFTILSLVE
ncbi:MAG: hypothetical protein N2511_03040 [Thermodesulfovibrionales bacterium]|nr:hypothetical protein [Thermodesulfovibrionales bacterium]